MKVLPLDKSYVTNTEYQAEHDKGLVITHVGTDTASDVTMKIDAKACGIINNAFAPKHKINTKLLTPLDLKNLFLVVPPSYKFTFESTATANVRLKGKLLVLGPGEAFPTDLLSRFAGQHNHYYTYELGTLAIAAAAAAWATDVEKVILTLSPTTIERYVLNHLFMAKAHRDTTVTAAQGEVGVKFYLDGAPLDVLRVTAPTMGPEGLDVLSTPYPPAETTEFEAFTLEGFPLEVLGDHVLEVAAKNISGGDLPGAAAETWTADVLAVVEYQKGA